MKKLILIIEDDVALLKGIEAALKTGNYEVITETDGERGYNLARRINPDLLLLDLNLPARNGFEICELLKREGKVFPIFILTGKSGPKDELHGLSLGADDYIRKPFNMQELLYRVRNALRHSDQLKIKEKEYEEEFLRAQRIHLDSLAQIKPEIAGLDIAAKTRPSRFIGGDYIDYIYFTDGRFGLIVADVSGKGMSAALIVNKIQGILQVIESKVNSAEDILLELQKYLPPILDDSLFVTAVTAVFDISNRKVQIARAGHLPVLLKREGKVEQIIPEGIFIGDGSEKFFKMDLKQTELDIKQGDSFLFFTDGITDSINKNGKEFGLERLSGMLRNNKLTTSDFLENCFSEIDRFTGTDIQIDDMTLVIAEINF